jgi:hypothetical protein
LKEREEKRQNKAQNLNEASRETTDEKIRYSHTVDEPLNSPFIKSLNLSKKNNEIDSAPSEDQSEIDNDNFDSNSFWLVNQF